MEVRSTPTRVCRKELSGMMHPVMLPPTRQPAETLPFAEQTHGGLFAAPWLPRPSDAEIRTVADLARAFGRQDRSPSEWNAVLGYLLAVRAHCLSAARAATAAGARAEYQEALRGCLTAINLLHHAQEGTAGDLAAWARGVHTLIRAQLAMPDVQGCETLAREATVILSMISDPLCAGADADARSAARLAREPLEVALRLTSLPDRALDKVEYFRHRVEQQEGMLNQRLEALTDAHRTGMGATLGWAMLNLLLMGSLPLNGVWRPDVPWSLPLAACVLILWWWTWDRPYRHGLRFFDWYADRRRKALEEFRAAAAEFPAPLEQYQASMADMLREARADREQLSAFYLFDLPQSLDTLDMTAVIGNEGKSILTGEWMAELNDRAPWPLRHVLPVEPTMLPYAYRIWYGGAAH